jgi:O-antigen ligase
MKLPPPPAPLVAISAICLAALLFIAILLKWISALWITPTLFQAGLFSLAAVWALRMVYRPYKLHSAYPLIPLAAAPLWGLLQIALHSTVAQWETSYAAFTWAGNLAAFFLALQICQSAPVRRRFLDALLVFGFLISVISLLQFFSAPQKIFWLFDDSGLSSFGPLENRDRYALFAELLMPIAIVRALAADDRAKAIPYIAVAATLFACTIACLSRAGSALVTAEAIVVLAIAGLRTRLAPARFHVTAAAFALAAVVFTAVVGVSALLDRFHESDPYLGRREMTLSAIAMARDRPMLGFGLGNYPNAYPKYAIWEEAEIVNAAHNDWAQWASEGGIPFFLLILSLVLWLLPKAFRNLWGIGLLSAFAHSYVDFGLQNPVMEFWFFVLLGIVAAESAGRQLTTQSA